MDESPEKAIAKSHIIVLTRYLASFPAKSSPQMRSVARQRLSTLTNAQFRDLQLDVYDELVRRLDLTYKASGAAFLPARRDYQPSRNEARRNMAKIPELGYADLCGDILYELEQRNPDLKTMLKRKATNETLIEPSSTPKVKADIPPPPDPAIMEFRTAKRHYQELALYLVSYLGKPHPDPSRSQARMKLAKLPNKHYLELSTDLYDEVMRRSRSIPALSFLPPNRTFDPQRNEARQKMAALSNARMEAMACDVHYELRRRYPQLEAPVRERSLDARDSSKTLVNKVRQDPYTAPKQVPQRSNTAPTPAQYNKPSKPIAYAEPPLRQYTQPMQNAGANASIDAMRAARHMQRRGTNA